MTKQGESTPEDRLWTPGEAAAYLNSGVVNLGFRSRRVADMIRRGDLPGVQTHVQGWHRVPSSAIRALRAEQLRILGHDDPDWPAGDQDPDQGVSAQH